MAKKIVYLVPVSSIMIFLIVSSILASPLWSYFETQGVYTVGFIQTGDWHPPTVHISMVTSGKEYVLTQQIRNGSFQNNLEGWNREGQVTLVPENTNQEENMPEGNSVAVELKNDAQLSQTFLSQDPWHTLSFWVQFGALSSKQWSQKESDFVVYIDDLAVLRVSSAEVVDTQWHLLAIPMRVGAEKEKRTITFKTSDATVVRLTGISTTRVLAADAQLLVTTEDTQAVTLSSSIGEVVQLASQQWQISVPEALEPLPVSIWAEDESGNQSDVQTILFWRRGGSISHACSAQRINGSSLDHVLIDGTENYDWFNPLFLQATESIFSDRFTQPVALYPIKRYTESESVLVDHGTSQIILFDMFGRSCELLVEEN